MEYCCFFSGSGSWTANFSKAAVALWWAKLGQVSLGCVAWIAGGDEEERRTRRRSFFFWGGVRRKTGEKRCRLFEEKQHLHLSK